MSSPAPVPQYGCCGSSEAQNRSRPTSCQQVPQHGHPSHCGLHFHEDNTNYRPSCDYGTSAYARHMMTHPSDLSRPVLLSEIQYPQNLTASVNGTNTIDFKSMHDPQHHVPVNYQTLEPRMMFHDYSPSHYLDVTVSGYPPVSHLQVPDPIHNSYGPCFMPMTPYEPQYSEEFNFSPVSSQASLDSAPSNATEDDEDDRIEDQPYAKLIYKALKQAPDHRMMLRDIYDWFIQNTNKPRESGSNGWQNSIRHNLSMNQAFENDKSETSSRGQPRKANSVWVLTKSAIENGVQSTTRYRKSTSFKKGLARRAPTAERQKSGSKGGKAARRVAVHRKQELPLRYNTYHVGSALSDEMSSTGWLESSASPSDQIFTPRYCPTSPTDDQCHTPAPDWAQSPLNIDTSTCMPHEYPQINGQPLDHFYDPTFDQLQTYVYGKDPLHPVFV